MIRKRPAEASGGLGSAATALAYAAGADTQTVAVVGIVAGLLPGAVSFVVDHGGLRGIARRLLNGNADADV